MFIFVPNRSHFGAMVAKFLQICHVLSPFVMKENLTEKDLRQVTGVCDNSDYSEKKQKNFSKLFLIR